MVDLLTSVRETLKQRVGTLPSLAKEVDIPYDTVLRIKNGEGDPGYSKVLRLYLHLHPHDEAAHYERGQVRHEMQE